MQRMSWLVAPFAGAAAIWWARDGAHFDAPGRRWAGPVGFIVCALAVVATPRLRKLAPWPGSVPFVYGGCLLAAYLCVPETDHIERLAPWFIGAVLVEVIFRFRLPTVVQFLGAPVVTAAALFGATGRQSALIGGLFALWPVLLVGSVVRRRRREVLETTALTRVGLVAIGGLAAACVSRTGGLSPSAWPAILAVLIAAPISRVLARWWVRRPSAQATPPTPA